MSILNDLQLNDLNDQLKKFEHFYQNGKGSREGSAHVKLLYEKIQKIFACHSALHDKFNPNLGLLELRKHLAGCCTAKTDLPLMPQEAVDGFNCKLVDTIQKIEEYLEEHIPNLRLVSPSIEEIISKLRLRINGKNVFIESAYDSYERLKMVYQQSRYNPLVRKTYEIVFREHLKAVDQWLKSKCTVPIEPRFLDPHKHNPFDAKQFYPEKSNSAELWRAMRQYVYDKIVNGEKKLKQEIVDAFIYFSEQFLAKSSGFCDFTIYQRVNDPAQDFSNHYQRCYYQRDNSIIRLKKYFGEQFKLPPEQHDDLFILSHKGLKKELIHRGRLKVIENPQELLEPMLKDFAVIRNHLQTYQDIAHLVGRFIYALPIKSSDNPESIAAEIEKLKPEYVSIIKAWVTLLVRQHGLEHFSKEELHIEKAILGTINLVAYYKVDGRRICQTIPLEDGFEMDKKSRFGFMIGRMGYTPMLHPTLKIISKEKTEIAPLPPERVSESLMNQFPDFGKVTFEDMQQHPIFQDFAAMQGEPFSFFCPHIEALIKQCNKFPKSLDFVFKEHNLEDILNDSTRRVLGYMQKALSLRMGVQNDFIKYDELFDLIFNEIKMWLLIAKTSYDLEKGGDNFYPYPAGTIENLVSARLKLEGEGIAQHAVFFAPSGMQARFTVVKALRKYLEDENCAFLVNNMAYYEAVQDSQEQNHSVISHHQNLESTIKVAQSQGKHYDAFFADIHVNVNCSPSSVYEKQDVIKQVRALMDNAVVNYPFTIVIDKTIGALHSDELDEIRRAFAKEIQEKQLNIICFESSQKFDTAGVDEANGGLITVFTANPELIEAVKHYVSTLPIDTHNYQIMAHIFSTGMEWQEKYRRMAFDNARFINDRMDKDLMATSSLMDQGIISIVPNSDPKTFFIYIYVPNQYKNFYRYSSHIFQHNFYKSNLPVISRAGFVYRTSVFSKINECTRFVPGFEDETFRVKFADAINKSVRDIRTAATLCYNFYTPHSQDMYKDVLYPYILECCTTLDEVTPATCEKKLIQMTFKKSGKEVGFVDLVTDMFGLRDVFTTPYGKEYFAAWELFNKFLNTIFNRNDSSPFSDENFPTQQEQDLLLKEFLNSLTKSDVIERADYEKQILEMTFNINRKQMRAIDFVHPRKLNTLNLKFTSQYAKHYFFAINFFQDYTNDEIHDNTMVASYLEASMKLEDIVKSAFEKVLVEMVFPSKKYLRLLDIAVNQNLPSLTKQILKSNYSQPLRYCKPGTHTLLHTAAEKGHYYIYNILLDAGFDPNICDEDDQIPLFLAIKNGHEDMVRNILLSGRSPLTSATTGNHVLHIAVSHSPRLFKIIYEMMPSLINVKNATNLRPLSFAQDIECYKFILNTMNEKEYREIEDSELTSIVYNVPIINYENLIDLFLKKGLIKTPHQFFYALKGAINIRHNSTLFEALWKHAPKEIVITLKDKDGQSLSDIAGKDMSHFQSIYDCIKDAEALYKISSIPPHHDSIFTQTELQQVADLSTPINPISFMVISLPLVKEKSDTAQVSLQSLPQQEPKTEAELLDLSDGMDSISLSNPW